MIPITAGESIEIAVENLGEGGLLVLDLSQPPANDLRANAFVEEGLLWETSGENGGATLSLGEASSWGSATSGSATIDRSVWWKWQAPRNGRFTLSTQGSNFDTVLTVYRDDDEILVEEDSTHLIFAIDRSAFTGNAYRTNAVYDANNNGANNEIIDQQIAAVIHAIKWLRIHWRYYDQYDPSLQIAVVVFDENAEFLDLDPHAEGINVWARIGDFNLNYDLRNVYSALRGITASEVETVDYNSAFQAADSLLPDAEAVNPRLILCTPGQNIADLDFQTAVDSFRRDDRDFAVMAPSIVSDPAALQVLRTDVLEYANYTEVFNLMRHMVAVNDDATWHGLWSRVTFNAIEGETYYFGITGYGGEYGNIQLEGRDPEFPLITQEPKQVKVDIGERAYFEVKASGQEPLLYQWYKNGVAIAGAHGASYSLWNTEIGDVGQYHVTVSNLLGQASSSPVQLQTNDIAPRFTFNPQDTAFADQAGLRLLAATVGTQPITYQWYQDGVELPQQTDAILNIASAGAAQVGEYYVVATNALGSTRSGSAVATIISGEFEQWKLREGNPQQEHLNGIAYGAQTFVAVGDSGRLLQSNDATHWQQHDFGTLADLKGIAFGSGVFVAAGSGGALYLAESPAYWEPIRLDDSINWRNVEYLDGVFWLTGDAGNLARSLNGRDWELVATGSSANLIGLTWGHDGFLLISDSAQYLTSMDGTTWTEQTAENGETSYSGSNQQMVFKDVSYFDGKYYVSNNLFTRAYDSTDLPPLYVGHSSNPIYFSDVSAADRLLAFSGSSRYVFSALYGSGGRKVTGRYEGGKPRPVAATYGQGFYVAAGNDGLILRSRDGLEWEAAWSIAQHRLHDLVYARDRYIATSRYGAVFSSPDGLWWETVREKYWGGNSSNAEQTFIVEHGNYLYIISPHGDHGRSQDGVLWEWFYGDRAITSVVSHGTQLLYTTANNLYSSSDMHGAGSPVFETALSSPTLTYGNGIFLLRATGLTRYSTDGLNWSDVEFTGDNPSGMLVAKDGVFLSQNMRWSDDGLHWETAGVMLRIPAESGEMRFKVATEEDIYWGSSNLQGDWNIVPDDTTFGYDLDNQLSFAIPETGHLAEAMHGQYSSLYIRYNLSYNLVQTLLSMELRTRFNDGFLVRMGNKLVAGAKAADSSEWDSVATGSQTLAETETLNVYDLTAGIGYLPSYSSRVVAFQVLNHSIDDGLFLFDFDLYGKQRLNLENVFAAGDYFFGVDAAGDLFVSEDARDWLHFKPDTGVLNKIIASPAGYTAVGDHGSVYQTRDQTDLGAKIYLRQPAEPSTVTIGEVVPLEVDAYAAEGSITNVSFYANNTLVASLSEGPFLAEWKPTAFGNYDLYAVATGSNGLKSISDRINLQVSAVEPWRLSSGHGEPQDLNAMEWMNGRWLAPGDAGKLYESPDGLVWDFKKLATDEDLLSITQAPDGTLVVGGANGGIFVSYDGGRNWLEEARFIDYPLKTVAYAFGRFYFAAYGKVFASNGDFQDWSVVAEQAGTSTPVGLEYGDGRLMLAWGNQIFETSDGEVWSQYTGADSLSGHAYQDLDYHDGAFYLTYRFTVSDYPVTETYSIETAGGAIARLDANGASIVYSTVYGDTLTTVSGLKQVRPAETLHFMPDGRGLLLGSATAHYDPHTASWSTAASSTLNDTYGFGPTHAPASYLTSNDDQFWIVYGARENGQYPPVVPREGRPLYSSDGFIWQEPGGGLQQEWGDVAYINNLYFAVGKGGSLLYSSDATEWTLTQVGPGEPLRAIDYGDGVYVVVGNNGFVASSTDLESWQVHELNTENDLHSVRYAEGQFIAAGFNAVFRASDGIHWTDIAPDYDGLGHGYQITSVRYLDGQWALVGAVNDIIFVGQISERLPLAFLSSDQGDSWTEMALPAFETGYLGRLYDLIYYNNQYLLIGYGRVGSSDVGAWTSPDLTHWTVLPEGAARHLAFDASGVYLAASNKLSKSQDLSNWETILEGSVIAQGPAIGANGIIAAIDNKIWRQLPTGEFMPAIGDSQSLKLDFITVINGAFWGIDGRSRIFKIEPDGQRSLQLSGGKYLDSLTWENGRFFALSGWGNYAPMTSVDGSNWSEIQLSEFDEVPPTGNPPRVQKIMHDGSRYMAIVRRGGGGTIKEYICTSTDSLNWEFAFPIAFSSQYSHFTENGVYYKNSRNVLQRSTDFQNWEVVLIGDSSSSSFGKANGRFFFNTFYTDDFINWYPTEGIDWAFDFVYSNGIYLVLNSIFEAGNVSLSGDGKSWSQVSTAGINPEKLLATSDGFVGLTRQGEIYAFPLSDLAVSEINWQAEEYGPGETVAGSLILENTGKIPWKTDEPLEIEVWWTRSDRLFGRQSFLLTRLNWDGTLTVGAQVEIPFNAVVPDSVQAGKYRSGVVIDPVRRTEDYNRANNLLIKREYDLLVPQWGVAFEINGGGAVLSRQPGALDFVHNTEETFVPVAQKGYLFGGWQNQEDPGLGPLTLTFNQNHEVAAIFDQAFAIELSSSGLGNILSNQQDEMVRAESTIELRAIPESGWRFEKWSGDMTSQDNPLFLTVSDDLRLRAHFIPHGGLSYPEWALAHAASDHSGPFDRGSGNQRENLLNYFLGAADGSDPVSPSLHRDQGYLWFNLPWNPEVQDVSFEVLYSQDLEKWLPLPVKPEAAVIDGQNVLRYPLNAASPGETYFFKVEVQQVND